MNSLTHTVHYGVELYGHVRRGVNTSVLRRDVQRPFRFLLCGDMALVAEMRSALLAPSQGVEPTLETSFLLETINPNGGTLAAGQDIRCVIFLTRLPQEQAPQVQLACLKVPIVRILVDDSAPLTSVPPTVPVKGTVHSIAIPAFEMSVMQARVFPHLVECCKGVEVAVGSRLPILREVVCNALTRRAARNSLKISAASAAIEQVPFLGLVLGTVTAAGDIAAISVVQVNLVLTIGAVYGREPDISTAWELVAIIGSGLGWRALSRELAGFVPGAGLAIKSAIAYAGTIVVGEGAAFYYRTGRYMSAAHAKELYHDTKRAAVDLAREMFERLRHPR